MTILKNKRRLVLLCIDFCILAAVYGLCVIVSVFAAENHSLDIEPLGYLLNFIIFAFVLITVRAGFRCYSNVCRYANSTVFLNQVVADAIGGMTVVVATYFIPYVHIGLWMGCAFVTMSDIATLSSRFVYQLYYRSRNANTAAQNKSKIHVAILGAGQVGDLLAEELGYDQNSKYKVVCFIDKDKQKIGATIINVPIIAQDNSVDKLKSLGVDEVFIAIPSLTEEKTKAIVDFYTKSGFKVKIYDFPIKDDGSSDVNAKRVIREVRIEDLLFRDMLSVVNSDTREYYKGKTVLVTGGGGSIGSEISRQIAKCAPEKLVIFDIYENNAYDIEQELRRNYGSELNLVVEIGSVRDRKRLEAVFRFP